MYPIENLKDLIIYQSQNNDNISVEVLYDDEDFWLTQKLMSKLFEVEVNTINYHLKEIFKSGELTEESVIRKIRITANDGKNYFKELLERICSIRTSERRIWQQITDIFAECSIDDDKNSDITQQFYATIQNKFHYAITGNTAA